MSLYLSDILSAYLMSSLFAYNVNVSPRTVGSGLVVMFVQSSYAVEVLVEDSVFTRNYGHFGASIAAVVFSLVAYTSFTVQRWYASGYPLPDGFRISCKEQDFRIHSDVLRVLNTQFTKNSVHMVRGYIL